LFIEYQWSYSSQAKFSNEFVDKSLRRCYYTNVDWPDSPSERYSTWDYCVLSWKSDIVDNKETVAARLSIEAKSWAVT
jgi:hypothetical protein